MQQEERISSIGIAVLILCGVTPFMRIVIGGSGILSLVLIPALVLFAYNFKKFRFLSGLKVKIILISLWLMFSTIYSPVQTSLSLENSKVQICTIMIFLYYLNKKEEKILTILAFAAAAVFIYSYFFSSDFYMAGIRKRILWQGTTWLDPNMVIASFIVPAIVGVKLFIEKKGILWKIGIVLFWGLSLYCAFLGSSRGGLIAIVIGAILYLVLELKPSAKTIFPAIGAVIVLIIAFNVVRSYIPENLLQRMTLASVSETGGSGRLDIYSEYIERFFSESNIFRLLFGYGKEACKLYLGKSAHNILIDYLWDLGITGLIFHLVVIFSLIKYCIKSKSVLSISCLVAVIIWSLGISTSDQLLYWVLLYTCVVYATNNSIAITNKSGRTA